MVRITEDLEHLALVFLTNAPADLRGEAMRQFACPTTEQLLEVLENEVVLKSFDKDLTEYQKTRNAAGSKTTFRSNMSTSSEKIP